MAQGAIVCGVSYPCLVCEQILSLTVYTTQNGSNRCIVVYYKLTLNSKFMYCMLWAAVLRNVLLRKSTLLFLEYYLLNQVHSNFQVL